MQITGNPKYHYNPKFSSSFFRSPKAYSIEKDLAKEAIVAEFENNAFVAESMYKCISLMKSVFGRSAIPKIFEMKKLNSDDIYAYYDSSRDIVAINRQKKCFDNFELLRKEMKKARSKVFFLPNQISSGHPLYIFIHELGHSAHYHNLLKKGHGDIFKALHYTRVPTAIGRLITKFKLSKYSLINMNEFMTERITQDITENLKDDNFIGAKKNLDYSNIFSNKWSYRYSSPQSYIDYFTQQIWDGNPSKAREIEGDIERYLAEIEAQHAPKVVMQAKTHSKSIPVLNNVTSWIANKFNNLTTKLNQRNDLRMDL